MRIINLLITVLVLGVFVTCEDPESDENNVDSSTNVTLNMDSESISVGGNVTLLVEISNFNLRIFAASMRISYDTTHVSISGNQSAWLGEIWSKDAIGLIKPEQGTIHLSATEVSNSVELGSATLFSIGVVAESAGTTSFTVDPEYFFCFDSTGAEIPMPDFEIILAELTIN